MVESKQVCCCGARVWTLVIGWLETILNGLGIVFYSGALVLISSAQSEEQSSNKVDVVPYMYALKEDRNKLREQLNETLKAQGQEFLDSFPLYRSVGLCAVFLIISVISMVMGILLITGVKQEQAGRLKAYIVWHACLLFFYCVTSVVVLMGVTIFLSALVPVVIIIIFFLISLFLMRVVDVHRKEILARSSVPVSAAYETPTSFKNYA